MSLAKELETYNSHLAEWAEHEGEYVLIKGDEVCDFFSSLDDALKAGYEKFQLEPFFIKQVSLIEQVMYFTRPITPCPTSPAK